MASKEERTALFLTKSKEKYGDLYDYSKVQYENSRIHVTVICSHHGDFHVSPDNFLSREIGCPLCSRESTRQKRRETYTQRVAEKGCGTNQFNVRGYQTQHIDLLRKIFG